MLPATQRSYISAVSKFSRYFGRSSDKLGVEDVRAFQVHLASTGISWPSLNQVVCALRFDLHCGVDNNLSSTARYTQVATHTIRATMSPFDRLTLDITPPG
jgi:hypothetical protein